MLGNTYRGNNAFKVTLKTVMFTLIPPKRRSVLLIFKNQMAEAFGADRVEDLNNLKCCYHWICHPCEELFLTFKCLPCKYFRFREVCVTA